MDRANIPSVTVVDEARVVTRARLPWFCLGFTVLPLLVSAVALLVFASSDFRPPSDWALTEMHVRDIGQHQVLVGLFSRVDWSHPGPMLFYLIAPFYWMTGGSSIGMYLGALAINAAAVVGMAIIAWRRGGTPMLLCTLVACALVMRTLGAAFISEPWNGNIVTLPFGLMLFATWALICGDRWALPIATIAASFLAQTHVGNVVLALPLLVFGAAWLVVPVLRRGADTARKRDVLRSVAISVAIGAVLWLPPALDALLHRPSNLNRILHYFQTSDERAHTLRDGWRVVTGQFAWPPEWLTYKRSDYVGFGESPFLVDSAVPWLLAPVVAAAAIVWRRRRSDNAGARYLPVVLAMAIVLGVVAVMRTLGPLLDYRLRWTWIPPVVAFVLVTWTAWQLAVRRWPGAERGVLVPAAIAILLVVTGVNLVTAGRAGTPWRADSEVVGDLTLQVLDNVDPRSGQVVISDPLEYAQWYARGLVLQLERAGVDARVTADRAKAFGRSRAYDADEPVQAYLVIAIDEFVYNYLDDPNFRLVARWQPAPESPLGREFRRRAALERDLEAGLLTEHEYFAAVGEGDLAAPDVSYSRDVAVFEDVRPDARPLRHG
jgi:hypothetical protein